MPPIYKYMCKFTFSIAIIAILLTKSNKRFNITNLIITNIKPNC